VRAFVQELRTGWRDLIGATLGLGCGTGCYTSVSSFFFRALEHEFGWSKVASAASLVALPVTAAVLPFAGSLLDRFGVRRVAMISALGMSASLLWLATMRGQLPIFYAAFITMNVVGCATGPISYTRTISMHFRLSRGTALAVALLGYALAGMLLPPLLASVMASSGWRGGYRVLAGIVLVGGVTGALLIRGSGDARPALTTTSGATLSQALRNSAFWLLGMAIFCISAASLGFLSQFQSIMIERGLATSRAPLLLSVLAGSVFVSRLIIGRALDAFAAERVAASALALAALGMLLWSLGIAGLGVAVVAIVLLGLSIGAELDLLSFFCARLFGLRHYSAIYGALFVLFYLGTAAGGVTFGAIYDLRGSYGFAIGLSAMLLLIASVLFLVLRNASNAALAAARLPLSDGGSLSMVYRG
jgi:predicted MFS family arabinose efflux permease